MNWIQHGGPLIWPILLCGAAAIVIVAERLYFFMSQTRTNENFRQRLSESLSRSNLVEASQLCREFGGLRPDILRPFLEREVANPGQPDLASLQREMNEVLNTVVIPKLSARLGILSTLGRITPLLGLLGTVQGMIQMFLVVGNQGTGMASNLAQGIAVALVTTFAGLSIAIPIQVVEGIFDSYIDSFVPKLQADLSWALGQLREIRFRNKVIRIEPEDLQ